MIFLVVKRTCGSSWEGLEEDMRLSLICETIKCEFAHEDIQFIKYLAGHS